MGLEAGFAGTSFWHVGKRESSLTNDILTQSTKRHFPPFVVVGYSQMHLHYPSSLVLFLWACPVYLSKGRTHQPKVVISRTQETLPVFAVGVFVQPVQGFSVH